MLDIIFRARNGAKGGSNGRTRTSEHEDGGLVKVLRRAEVLELGHCLVSLRADGVLQSRAKRFSTRDPAARGGMVSLGRGKVGGLAKGNARGLDSPGWAEAVIRHTCDEERQSSSGAWGNAHAKMPSRYSWNSVEAEATACAPVGRSR